MSYEVTRTNSFRPLPADVRKVSDLPAEWLLIGATPLKFDGGA